MNRCAEAVQSWMGTAARIYEAEGMSHYIHSVWQHDVSYRSSVCPDVSVTIPVLFPHYTDRYEED